MKSRASTIAAILLRTVRGITAPLTPELARLTEETALIIAMAGRSNVSDGSELLRRAAEAKAALFRIEQQLNGSLAGQPREIAEDGRIRDVRLSIEAIKTRLESVGG